MPLLLPTLSGDLVDIYNKGKKGNPFPAAVGIKTGKAYVSYVSAGINAGGGAFTSMPGGSVLGGDLAEILSKVPTASGNITAANMATALARALNNYTLAAIVIGVIPDTPGIPFTGPIS